MKKDIEIAQENIMEPIRDVAQKLNIKEDYLEYYGKYKAKISPEINKELAEKKDGKLILVTSINPTKAGEGKSTTTVALVDGLSAIGKKVCGALREPSLGPVFGLKGGAAGGGYAQVVPMDDINLHFTGDMHAITTCNNLIAAVLDNHIYQGNELNIDPNNVVFKRCLDLNDRTLRDITIGQKKRINGVERPDHFLITVASEVMAILCLSNDLKDFENKIKEITVAYTYDGKEVKVKDLKVEGALSIIMKDAIKPNIVQTLEHTPVLIHGGPFANIAHGCNSVIATKMALKLADYVVTEAGFGADLGAEKFLNIKCRKAGLTPSTIVVVVTCRALKLHAGIEYEELSVPNPEAVREGLKNVRQHIKALRNYEVPLVITLNKFADDTIEEMDVVKEYAQSEGIPYSLCEGFALGFKGSVDLARTVVESCEKPTNYHPLYDETLPIKEKIKIIATKQYGAADVEYSELAVEKIETLTKAGYDKIPVCIAKTPLSLTDSEKSKECEGFTIHVKDLDVSAGAGFVVVYTGNINTMPGLPKVPAALNMGIDDNGKIYGLF
jgi:formate--tetrahydrofolate ligase